jgi:hypothetical protein
MEDRNRREVEREKGRRGEERKGYGVSQMETI